MRCMGQSISLKSEINNPWFKPWFDILLHTQDCVWHSIRSMFRVLGMYNFGCAQQEYTIASKILWQRRLKIIVVSTWKSGSTLLSDLLASMPNSFVIYEPLHHFGIHRLISTTDKIYNEVISLLTSLLDCDFSIFKSE